MLVHLDKNKMTLFNTSQSELYSLLIKVADHSIAQKHDPRRRRPTPRPTADEEVVEIAEWIRKRADRLVRGEHQITYKELRRILERFGYSLQNPKKNAIEILKKETETKGIFSKREVTVYKHIGAIGYPGDNHFVAMKVLKSVRMICRLREEDGVGSDAFYDEATVVDSFVNRYRTILRRLART